MSESRFAPLLRADLAELRSYEPNPGTFAVRLDANESPALLSPEASAALARAMVPEHWSRYPDARATELRARDRRELRAPRRRRCWWAPAPTR